MIAQECELTFSALLKLDKIARKKMLIEYKHVWKANNGDSFIILTKGRSGF